MKKPILFLSALLLTFSIAQAQVPGTISYQGILVDGSGVPVTDGNHFVRFYFYTAPSGGSPVYSSTGTGAGNGVTTYKGMFTFIIGSGSVGNDPILPAIFNQQLYVEVIADNVMQTPRIQLTTVPYSMTAQLANGLSGTVALVNGGTGGTTAASARTNLGVEIGADVQAFDADLTDLADGTLSGSKVGTGIAAGNITSGSLAIANGGTGGATAAAARTNLSLVIGTDLQAFDAELADLADGSLTGSLVGAGIIATNITSGLLAVTNGGTGASTATAARTNLGLVIGTDVQAFDADLTDLADGSLTGSKVGSGVPAANISGLGSLALLSTVGSAEITNASIAAADLSPMGAASNQVMMYNGSIWTPTTLGAGGTVSSVDLSLPSIFSVSGNPVTTSGTLTATLASQTANTFFGSPNGSAGSPSFRALVAADIPNLDAGKITTGTIALANGGTGAATAAAARTNLGLGSLAVLSTVGAAEITNASITAADLSAMGAGSNQVMMYNGSIWTPTTLGAGGTVSSVDLSLPSIFSVSGNPVTTSGTLTAALTSQSANTIFSAPNGSAGAPTFRLLAAADIPNHDASKITSGTIAIANGGTNAATAAAARTNLGLVIGTDVQAFDADLTDLADGVLSGSKVGTGIDASFVTLNTLALANGGTGAGTASGARTNLGLAIGTDVQAFDADLTDLADGVLSGSKIGTGIDASFVTLNTLALANGGTGAGTASAARTNLGLIIGTDVQAFDADLTDLADGSLTGSKVGSGIAGGNITDATILTAKIADDAITTAKIGSGGVPDANKILTTDASGNPQWELKTTVATSGSGTSGYVTLWSGTNTLATSGTGTSAFFWDNGTSRLGLGTISPNRRLTISGTGGVENDILVETFAASGSGTLRFTRAQGTSTTPTAALAGDLLGNLAFAGYNGSLYSNGASVQGYAETAFNSAVNGYLTFSTASAGSLAEKLRINSLGNVGIGLTSPQLQLHVHNPGAVTDGLRITNATSGSAIGDGFEISSNGSTNAFVWNYENGSIRFATNNLDRMIINSLGNVGIGTIGAASKLDVEGGVSIGATYSGTTAAPANGAIIEGNVGIGTNSASYPLTVLSSAFTIPASLTNNYSGASLKYGLYNVLSSAGTSTKYGILNQVDGTAANASVNYGVYNQMTPNGTGTIYGTYNLLNSLGTGSRYGTSNNVYGLAGNTSPIFGSHNFVNHSGTGVTYGVYADVNKAAAQAGTLYGLYIVSDNDGTGDSYLLNANSVGSTAGTEYGLYVTGEDINYFSNKVGIGIAAPLAELEVNGNSGVQGVVIVKRLTDDGVLIRFRRDATTVGDISVAGATVSYNAFTGSHYGWTNETIERGMLVTLTGNNKHLENNDSGETIYGINMSGIANDSKIMGAYLALQNPSSPADLSNPHLIMAVGNGEIWVADKGEDLKIGDYLISSDIQGHAMKDVGEFDIANVVARVAEPINWSEVSLTIDGIRHKRISVFFESFTKNHKAERLETEMGKLNQNFVQISKEVELLKSQLGQYKDLSAEVETLKMLMSIKANPVKSNGTVTSSTGKE